MNKVMRDDFERLLELDLDYSLFKNSRVLVTGASGFIPSFLLRFLQFLSENRNLGVEIYALVRDGEKARSKFQDLNVKYVVQDVCDQIDANLSFDFVFHAASKASPRFYSEDPVGVLSSNILGTLNLLDHCRKSASKAFVLFSSGEVYGVVDDEKIPMNENELGYVDPAALRSCYAEGKRASENACVSYAHQFGVPAKIARIFHTYGPGMDLGDGRVHSDFVSDIVGAKEIVMKSSGSARRPFCYVADVVAGLLTIALKGKSGEPYNLGNPEAEVSVLELAELLVDEFESRGASLKRHTQDNKSYMESPIPRNSPNVDKLKSLGWSPRVGLREGFKRTVESYL